MIPLIAPELLCLFSCQKKGLSSVGLEAKTLHLHLRIQAGFGRSFTLYLFKMENISLSSSGLFEINRNPAVSC